MISNPIGAPEVANIPPVAPAMPLITTSTKSPPDITDETIPITAPTTAPTKKWNHSPSESTHPARLWDDGIGRRKQLNCWRRLTDIQRHYLDTIFLLSKANMMLQNYTIQLTDRNNQRIF